MRQARHASGMSQAALARAAGTRERNIIRWENEQHAPRIEHVAAIAEATGKPLDYFFTDDDEEDALQPLLADLYSAVRAIVQDEVRKAAA